MTSASSTPAARRCAAPTRVLILGGTSEASRLAAALAGQAAIDTTLSLAGRTAAPSLPSVAVRIGGFGGSEGLATYIRSNAVDILVNATHPFAAEISRNARTAAAIAGCKLVEVSRPAWVPQVGDRWTEVATMVEAAALLAREPPRRVFLTIGRQQLAVFAGAPQHHYLVRTIEPVASDHGLASATFIEARGPFTTSGEEALMGQHGIDVLVTKNSGGDAACAKLAAARALAIPVVIIARPPAAAGPGRTVAEAIATILAHRAEAERGV